MKKYNHGFEVTANLDDYSRLALRLQFKIKKILRINRGDTVIFCVCCGEKKWKEIQEFFKPFSI